MPKAVSGFTINMPDVLEDSRKAREVSLPLDMENFRLQYLTSTGKHRARGAAAGDRPTARQLSASKLPSRPVHHISNRPLTPIVCL